MISKIDRKFSKNVSVAKVFAITGIIFGHYWKSYPISLPLMSYWWVTSAIGLLIFSITSGYFTAIKYKEFYDYKSFWKRKAYRIGVPFTIVNFFLLILFVIEGKENIISTQTFASFLGIHGIWAWLGIPHSGPFGAGLWFMTTLLLFYIFYPFIIYLNRNRAVSYLFTITVVMLCLVLDHYIQLGYTLWLTISGFFVGVWLARNNLPYSFRLWICTLIFSSVIMLMLKFHFNIKFLNSFLVILISISIVQICKTIILPNLIYNTLLPISSCVLSMYIVHVYLFVAPTGLFFLNWILTLAIIIFVSYVVHYLAKKIEDRLNMSALVTVGMV